MTPFKILTLNAGMLEIDFPILRNITLVKHKNIRVHGIIELLQKSDYDIVMLQEIGGTLLKKIIHGLREFFPYQATHRAWKLFSYNLLILSKHPLLNSVFIPFKKQTFFEGLGITKGFLCADVVHHGTTYHLINTHLVASGTEMRDSTKKVLSVRNNQIHQLKQYVKDQYHNDDLVIIGGDFNAGPHSCQENYDVIVDELYDVMQHAPDTDRITWTSQNPLAQRSARQDPEKQIDGFYIRHHHYEQMKDVITINRTFTEPIELIHKDKVIKTPVSDHYGVELIIHNKNTL